MGRQLLSMNRSLVLDTLHFARRMPLFPVEQTFDLADLAALRAAVPQRISWTVLFLKAQALVATRRPQLRQTYLPFPWPHLYEHPHSVACVPIQRQYQGEDRLCWGRFQRPERTSLDDLQRALDRYQREPVEVVFRRQVRLSRLPGVLRRMGWRLSLYPSGNKRAKRLGTFSLSSLAGQATLNRFHPTIHTTSLSYGPLDGQGRALVTLICDHRVLDGSPAASVLSDLQAVLQTEIAGELRSLASVRRVA